MSFQYFKSLVSFTSLVISLVFCASCSDDPITSLENLDPDVPFAIVDLTLAIEPASGDESHILRLNWTATGDDGPNGTAASYDLRRHNEPLTLANWAAADQIVDISKPRLAGSAETFTISFPQGSPTSFMAIRAIDDAGNISALSNLVYADLEAPSEIIDLQVLQPDDKSAVVRWTAPLDDGLLERASRYEYRISQTSLTAENWDDTQPSIGPINPLAAGGDETFALRRLAASTHYFVAFRSYDENGNRSALSNIVEFETTATPRGWWDGFDNMGANQFIASLYEHEGLLYVGGRFTQVGPLSTTAVAAWDGANWSALGSGLSGGQLNIPMTGSFAAFQGSLYVGGNFFQAGDATALNVARWDGKTWEGLGDGPGSFGPGTMTVYNGNLYMGGQYNGGGASPFINLTGYDGANFFSLSWPEEQFSTVLNLTVRDENLVVAGHYNQSPGGDARSLVIYDGSSWSRPDLPVTSSTGKPSILSVIEFNDELYIAGHFYSDSNPNMTGILRWDGSSWHSLGKGLRSASEEQAPSGSAMTVFRGKLVVGGYFAQAGDVEAQNIAVWNGYFWSTLGEGIEVPATSNGRVTSLANYQGSLYVGGIFDRAGGQISRNIARWDVE